MARGCQKNIATNFNQQPTPWTPPFHQILSVTQELPLEGLISGKAKCWHTDRLPNVFPHAIHIIHLQERRAGSPARSRGSRSPRPRRTVRSARLSFCTSRRRRPAAACGTHNASRNDKAVACTIVFDSSPLVALSCPFIAGAG